MTLGIVFGIMLVLALGLVLLPVLQKKDKGQKKKLLPYVVGGVTILAAAGIYFLIGRPDLVNPPSFPEGFGDGAFGPEDEANLPSVTDMVNQLKARLEENPESVEGWSLLGQSLMVVGRFEEAADAYRKAIALAPDDPELHSGLGEALLLLADGTVTDDAAKEFEAAIALDPVDPIARFYLGDYAFQEGKYQDAYDRWLALFDEMPVDTPWLNLLDQRIHAAAEQLGIEVPASVTEKSLAAQNAHEQEVEQEAMSQEDQQEMIQGMVAQLAERLAEDPSDMDGWMRLGRSYMVLGRPADAAEAYLNVVNARPDDVNALGLYVQAALSAMEENGEPVSEAMIGHLETLEELDPNNFTALYYLGVAALQAGDKETARSYWQKLLALLPEGSMDARFVQDQIDQIG